MLYTYKLLCLLMARKTCPDETITVQLHNKHVLSGKEHPRYLSARSPKTTGYKRAVLGTTILANGKAHFGPTDRNDQTGHCGPPSKLVAPNRNGPFHLLNQPKFPEFWVEWKAPPLFPVGPVWIFVEWIAPAVSLRLCTYQCKSCGGGGGECGQGAGIWCLRISPCWAFDRAKRPRGRDIWLRPIEAWYQFRSGNQVRPSRLSETHAVG